MKKEDKQFWISIVAIIAAFIVGCLVGVATVNGAETQLNIKELKILEQGIVKKINQFDQQYKDQRRVMEWQLEKVKADIKKLEPQDKTQKPEIKKSTNKTPRNDP